jgi:hypothetical protein
MQKLKTKNFWNFGKIEIKRRAIVKTKSKMEKEILKKEAIKIPPIKERQK